MQLVSGPWSVFFLLRLGRPHRRMASVLYTCIVGGDVVGVGGVRWVLTDVHLYRVVAQVRQKVAARQMTLTVVMPPVL